MTIKKLLESGRLTKKGVLSLIEGLLEGEVQVDVNTGQIFVCHGMYPQSYAPIEDIIDPKVEDEVDFFNNSYGQMGDVYDSLKIVAKILEIELPEVK